MRLANPFDPLAIVEESSQTNNAHVVADGLHLKLLRHGDEMLWASQYQQAEEFYLRCLNHIQWMPEAKFRMGLCKLYQGDAAGGMGWMGKLIEYIRVEYKAIAPDPVEWAYYIISMMCFGETR